MVEIVCTLTWGPRHTGYLQGPLDHSNARFLSGIQIEDPKLLKIFKCQKYQNVQSLENVKWLKNFPFTYNSVQSLINSLFIPERLLT